MIDITAVVPRTITTARRKSLTETHTETHGMAAENRKVNNVL